MTVFDFDDHCEQWNAMPWMRRLKDLNPAFKATLFSIPALGTPTFWRSHPHWIELVPHGWLHPTPYECSEWTRETTFRYLRQPLVRMMARGFKAPGWQISDATYEVLERSGYWVADQHLEDGRRPAGLPVYFYEDGNWHGHVTNVCGNGIEETWDELCDRVASTTHFAFASEAAGVNHHRHDPRERAHA